MVNKPKMPIKRKKSKNNYVSSKERKEEAGQLNPTPLS
jgi:hypothetical protein